MESSLATSFLDHASPKCSAAARAWSALDGGWAKSAEQKNNNAKKIGELFLIALSYARVPSALSDGCVGCRGTRSRVHAVQRRGAAVEHALMQAEECQLQAVSDNQFVIDPAEVVLDHLFRGAELLGNGLIAKALRDQPDDMEFLV